VWATAEVIVLGANRLVTLAFQAPDLLLVRPRIDRLGLGAQPDPRRRLIDQVDGLVREEAVADVAIGQLRGGHDRLVGDPDPVIGLVPILQAVQDLDGAEKLRSIRDSAARAKARLAEVQQVVTDSRALEQLRFASMDIDAITKLSSPPEDSP
jgi:hypothetical protein